MTNEVRYFSASPAHVAVKDWKDSWKNQSPWAERESGPIPTSIALLYRNVFGAKWRLVSGLSRTNDTMRRGGPGV